MRIFFLFAQSLKKYSNNDEKFICRNFKNVFKDYEEKCFISELINFLRDFFFLIFVESSRLHTEIMIQTFYLRDI